MKDYRSQFPILETCTYLINHSLAAMPAQAEDNLLEYARMWRERGIRSPVARKHESTTISATVTF